MSDYRDKMSRRMKPKGLNDGESIHRNAVEFANKNFHKSPSYRRVKVLSTRQPDLKEIDARVMSIERMGDIREILFRPYEGVDVGTYLSFDGETYLIYEKFGSIKAGKVKVLAEKCTEEVRWKQSDDEIYSLPCVASATQLGSKANQGKNALEWNKFDVRLPLGQIFVFVQKNDETSKIKLSQRFIFGSNAYEVLGFDDVTSTDFCGHGFIQITAGLTTKREGDDFKNKVADNDFLIVPGDETEPPTIPDTPEDDGGRMW